ncbi:MAG: PD-(D/E)XK nuclease family protein [Patescibacteria group bacterium]|nr:PD-(D/E)XK nuclease family protein [Patescibacteria group bacterium]MDE2439234.1 PD-(D/E)XK nuclease family protein [Patescibacteria group bacterium]
MSADKITIIADSTQIQSFTECPQEWYYNYRLHITKKDQKPKEAIEKGSYGHKLLELYYKDVSNGVQPVQAIENACGFDPDRHTNCSCGHAESSHSSIVISPETNLSTCRLCSGTDNYRHVFSPKPLPLSAPLRLQVQERFRVHCLANMVNDIRPHSAATVEVGFSERIYEDCEHLFVLEGKLDLLGRFNGIDAFMDHKFQERAHTLYKKKIQFRNYSMITGVKLLIVNYIRFAKSAEKPLERALIPYSTDEHTWWKSELIKIFKSMAAHLKSADRHGTLHHADSHRWGNCDGKWGSPCQYTDLCEERNLEHVKLIKIENNFMRKEEWRPW